MIPSAPMFDKSREVHVGVTADVNLMADRVKLEVQSTETKRAYWDKLTQLIPDLGYLLPYDWAHLSVAAEARGLMVAYDAQQVPLLFEERIVAP